MREHSGGDRANRRACFAAMIVAGIGWAACSDSTAANSSATELALSAAPTVAESPASIIRSGDTLALSQITVTVRDIELKRERGRECDSSGPGSGYQSDPACAKLRLGSATVDLPLSGDVITIPADAIPPGPFHEFEVHLSTVRLRGTFNGQAFDVTLAVNVKSEIEFEPDLVVVAGTATSIRVNLPVADWFVNSDGSLLDPGLVAGNAVLMGQLQSRIATSLRAFEDRDHDGRDDRGRRGPG